MKNTRTGGMTTMGILNIVFGAFGTLGSLLAILGGGLIAASGAAMEAEMGAEAEGMGAMAAAGGGFVMLIGLVLAVCSILLVVAGIGVLKLAPWGRKLSIISGGGFVLLSLVSLFGSGFTLSTIIGIAYGGTLLVLCFTETWKKAFAPVTQSDDFPSAASAASPSFAAIPAAEGTPGTPGTSGTPGQSTTPAQASKSGASEEPASTGLPGMPPPSKKNQDNDDVASAA